jgi:hypothetical protein
MKVIATAILAASIAAVALPAAADAPVCIDSYRIDSTNAPDSHHLIFKMKDGTKWTNTLKSACPGLRFNGFVYEPTAGRQVCANLQTIRVLDGGGVCMLGAFEKTSTPNKPA